jgi:hypothetical protein
VGGASFDTSGVAELRRAADAAGAAVADTRTADTDAAAVVGPLARGTSPRATGRTAASLSWGATADGFGVEVGVDHAVPLHWGAPANNQAARPWVADAFRRSEADIERVYETHLDNAVDVFDRT